MHVVARDAVLEIQLPPGSVVSGLPWSFRWRAVCAIVAVGPWRKRLPATAGVFFFLFDITKLCAFFGGFETARPFAMHWIHAISRPHRFFDVRKKNACAINFRITYYRWFRGHVQSCWRFLCELQHAGVCIERPRDAYDAAIQVRRLLCMRRKVLNSATGMRSLSWAFLSNGVQLQVVRTVLSSISFQSILQVHVIQQVYGVDALRSPCL